MLSLSAVVDYLVLLLLIFPEVEVEAVEVEAVEVEVEVLPLPAAIDYLVLTATSYFLDLTTSEITKKL